MTKVDLKALFIKYIQHVVEEEGLDFIDNWRRKPNRFTNEEWECLRALSKEAEAKE